MNSDQIVKYVKTQNENIKFIRKRIALQKRSGYNPCKLVSVNFGKEFKWSKKLYRFERNKLPTIITTSHSETQYTPYDIVLIKRKIQKALSKINFICQM